MHRAQESVVPAEERRIDRLLWISLLLGPLAMGVNTVVGYTVAHWVCDVNRKKTAFIVSAIDFIVCLFALALAVALERRIPEAEDSLPRRGRRHFMAKMAILLSVLSILLVLGGTLAVSILRPCD